MDSVVNQITMYETADGKVRIEVRFENENLWLSQKLMAEFFNCSTDNISLHLKNIFKVGELNRNSVTEEYSVTAADGKNYRTKFYGLEAIIAVGYRVNSTRGSQFRIWATNILKEYIIKGFAMDDERLKQADKWNYFDEWLERIRDIRASEKRFYQKIRDIYATAVDYDKTSEQAQIFFKKVQNIMLWTVTGKTAAEIIVGRSDPDKANMGFTSWKGSIVRKTGCFHS